MFGPDVSCFLAFAWKNLQSLALVSKKKRLHKRHYSRFETPLPTAGLGGVWFIAAVMRGASIITWYYSHQPAVLLFRKQRKTNNKSAENYTRVITIQSAIEPSNEHIFSQRNAKCAWPWTIQRTHFLTKKCEVCMTGIQTHDHMTHAKPLYHRTTYSIVIERRILFFYTNFYVSYM